MTFLEVWLYLPQSTKKGDGEMKALMKLPQVFYPLQKAQAIAAELNSYDDDDSYEVVDCKNGLGRIDVYDEDGLLIHAGFGV